MRDDYIISVVTSQVMSDDNTDKIELITAGSYNEKNGAKYIIYTEYSDDGSPQGCRTTVKIKPSENGGSVVTVSRRGDIYSDLVLEQGVRHQCHYNTPMGLLVMGVYTIKTEISLNNGEGTVLMVYDIDFNSDFISRNTCLITLKRKPQ